MYRRWNPLCQKTCFQLAVTIAVLCASSAFAQDDAKKVEASLKTWQKTKTQCKGNYVYKVGWSSFAGVGGETKIVVKNNKVVERSYREFQRRQPVRPGTEPKDDTKWVEQGDAIGSQKQGAPAKTLDQLYQEAEKIAQRELKEFEKRYVRTNPQGLLLTCFIVDTRIADDAPIEGVRISSIEVEGTVYKAPNGKAFPKHWGAPPRIQTRDLRPLPGGYGRGSGTLARWIQQNLDRDAKAKE